MYVFVILIKICHFTWLDVCFAPKKATSAIYNWNALTPVCIMYCNENKIFVKTILPVKYYDRQKVEKV